MTTILPVAVVIPTYCRGNRVLGALERICCCDPQPSEILVHIDDSDGKLEAVLARSFPSVRVISGSRRIGPGGGRHCCLNRCGSAYAVSFDDDSYPVDTDFFARVCELFSTNLDAAVIGARIWHPYQNPEARNLKFVRKSCFTGCGHAIRLSAYRATRGYLPLPVAYAMEEVDLSLQLFARGWKIYESSELRVFHDSHLTHHQNAETTAGFVTNVALFGFLNYPFWCWPWAFLQLGNIVWYCIKRGRLNGIVTGLIYIPKICFSFRKYRSPFPASTIVAFMRYRRKDGLMEKKSC
jgi:GT2 family glycosyltransferase